MASWMVHFRIADRLLDELALGQEEFIVGNIGPDCGEPNEDWSAFYPSTNISHWQDTEDKSGINSEAFYEEYLRRYIDESKQSFYLGYYIHLLTDIIWRQKIYRPVKDKYKEQFQEDENYIWKVKEDWYDLDHLYLKKNPDFRTFRIFDQITSFPNRYLDYYSETAIEKRIRYISDFYNTHEGNLDREYPYLTERQMDAFVEEAVEIVKDNLRQKGILK